MSLSPHPKAYSPATINVIPGGEKAYLQTELRKVSESIRILITLVEAIDARLTAHGI